MCMAYNVVGGSIGSLNMMKYLKTVLLLPLSLWVSKQVYMALKGLNPPISNEWALVISSLSLMEQVISQPTKEVFILLPNKSMDSRQLEKKFSLQKH